ncbi:MAG: hypothetical protein LBU38_03905 [Propionibacteriaceae bacterium]|jgi:kanamycin kinase|nr:hypothetical protein [Propionibacteriaceae bacterium]
MWFACINALGDFAGLVGVGGLGVTGRWAELAIATWPIAWNFGSGWDAVFYQTHSMMPDPMKEAFYRLVWQLT